MRLQPACLLTLLLLLLSLSAAAAAVTQQHASMSPQQTRWRQRQISGWTYFSSCGDTMCANMSTQLARIVKHSDTIDTMFVGLGGAAQHYNINHSLCYNSTSQPIADTSNTFPWATFRFSFTTGGSTLRAGARTSTSTPGLAASEAPSFTRSTTPPPRLESCRVWRGGGGTARRTVS